VRRKLRIASLVLLALLASVACAAAYVIGPRNVVGMLLYDQRREGDLRVGDAAPDVVLGAIDGAPDVRLADLVGDKPLVLVFGSFT
jgi:hypothetical protein